MHNSIRTISPTVLPFISKTLSGRVHLLVSTHSYQEILINFAEQIIADAAMFQHGISDEGLERVSFREKTIERLCAMHNCDEQIILNEICEQIAFIEESTPYPLYSRA
jgi:hypothetical protein